MSWNPLCRILLLPEKCRLLDSLHRVFKNTLLRLMKFGMASGAVMLILNLIKPSLSPVSLLRVVDLCEIYLLLRATLQ